MHNGDVATGPWSEANELHTGLPFTQVDMALPDKWQGGELEDMDVSVNEDGIVIAVVRPTYIVADQDVSNVSYVPSMTVVRNTMKQIRFDFEEWLIKYN